MDIAALDMTKQMPSLASLGTTDVSANLKSFAAKLRDKSSAPDPSGKDAAREAAEKLVATTLVVPLLAELREQPLDAKLFDGGFAEDAFRQQLDTALADEIVKSTQFPIVDRIYRDITRHAEREQAAKVNTHA